MPLANDSHPAKPAKKIPEKIWPRKPMYDSAFRTSPSFLHLDLGPIEFSSLACHRPYIDLGHAHGILVDRRVCIRRLQLASAPCSHASQEPLATPSGAECFGRPATTS